MPTCWRLAMGGITNTNRRESWKAIEEHRTCVGTAGKHSSREMTDDSARSVAEQYSIPFLRRRRKPTPRRIRRTQSHRHARRYDRRLLIIITHKSLHCTAERQNERRERNRVSLQDLRLQQRRRYAAVAVVVVVHRTCLFLTGAGSESSSAILHSVSPPCRRQFHTYLQWELRGIRWFMDRYI